MLKYIVIIMLTVISTYSVAQNTAGQVLDQYHQAASDANFERYFNTMADNAIILGTDGTERWTKETFQDFVEPYFSKGRGWTYKVIERNLTTAKADQVIFFDELLMNEAYGHCRGSGVLINTANGWKILQYNLTFVVPNDVSSEVVTSIKQFRKLTH